jgi:putative ABC transport system substrate-binding protein
MKRRRFIALLGGAAAWPLAARAQQAGKLRTIGFAGLSTRSAESELVAAFAQRAVIPRRVFSQGQSLNPAPS